jgi:hypothetical protein
MLPGIKPAIGPASTQPDGRDQALVLVQLGLFDPAGLPVAGVEAARKFENPGLPSVIERPK